MQISFSVRVSFALSYVIIAKNSENKKRKLFSCDVHSFATVWVLPHIWWITGWNFLQNNYWKRIKKSLISLPVVVLITTPILEATEKGVIPVLDAGIHLRKFLCCKEIDYRVNTDNDNLLNSYIFFYCFIAGISYYQY